MYSESDIDAAVTAGAITPESAAALRRHVATIHAAPAVDEEHFRLLTGFNDIFVSIAIVLLLAAVARIGIAIAPVMGGGLVAAVAWGLAEYFTRRRRMALPSILLLLAFVGGVAAAPIALIVAIEPALPERVGAIMLAGIAALAALAAWLHWRRFAVPITIAAGASAIVGVVVSLVLAAIPGIRNAVYPLLLIGGVAVFALAMRWDLSDRERRTRRSDVAFWLHLTAAPLIAHPVFQMIGGLDGEVGIGTALVVLALYVAFAVLGLAVDRRALLVSSLVYVLYAMYALFRSAGAVELSAAFTAMVIGSALLTLSAFWQPMRARVVGLVSETLRRRLPPVQTAA